MTEERGVAIYNANRGVQNVNDNEAKKLALQCASVWPRDLNNEQRMSIARLALAYHLDPLMGELTVYQGKPWITIDGRLRLATESGSFQGIVDDRPATDDEYKALRVDPNTTALWFISVKRADFVKPNGRYGRAMYSGDRNKIVGTGIPAPDMARKRALWAALREAYPARLPGIYEDEMVSTNTETGTVDAIEAQSRPNNGQLAAIHAIVKRLGWTDEQYRALLTEDYHVRSASELTEFQASDLLTYLSSCLDRRENEANTQVISGLFGDAPVVAVEKPLMPPTDDGRLRRSAIAAVRKAESIAELNRIQAKAKTTVGMTDNDRWAVDGAIAERRQVLTAILDAEPMLDDEPTQGELA